MSHEALRKVHDLLVAKIHADVRRVSEKRIGGAKELIFEGTCKEGGVRIDDGRDRRRRGKDTVLKVCQSCLNNRRGVHKRERNRVVQ